MEHEIYKVTSIDADGRSVISYVLPAFRRTFAKSMAEEYGNVEVEGLSMAEVPPGIIPEA